MTLVPLEKQGTMKGKKTHIFFPWGSLSSFSTHRCDCSNCWVNVATALPSLPSCALYHSRPQSSSKLQDENHTAALWQSWEQVPGSLGSCLLASSSTNPSCCRQSMSQAVGDFSSDLKCPNQLRCSGSVSKITQTWKIEEKIFTAPAEKQLLCLYKVLYHL